MGSKKVCRWSLLFSLCLHFTTKSWYLQKNIWNIIAAMTCMWILWALNFGGIVVEWLGHWTSLVVSGSALHPNTHCFVFGCPKFNSQAVLVKSLLVCPMTSWDLCFCNVYLQFVWIGPEKPYWGSGQWLLSSLLLLLF